MKRIILMFVAGVATGFGVFVGLGVVVVVLTTPLPSSEPCPNLQPNRRCVFLPEAEIQPGERIQRSHLKAHALPDTLVHPDARLDGGIGRTASQRIVIGEFVRPERLR